MKFKRFLCYFLATLLTVFVVSSANYKSVHAFEWVSGALVFSEAMTWVLASLGITTVVGDYTSEVDMTRQEFWQSYERDFYTYVNDHEGNTASDRFVAWSKKFCSGVVDKSSEYWDMFRQWANSLVNNTGSGGSGGAITSYALDYSSVSSSFSSICSYFNLNSATYNVNDSFDYCVVWKNSTYLDFRFVKCDYPFYCRNSSDNYIYFNNGTYGYKVYSGYYTFSTGNWSLSTNISNQSNNSQILLNPSNTDIIASNNIINESDFTYDIFTNGNQGTVADKNFLSVTGYNENTDIVSRTGEEEDEEVKVKMPGLEDSDDTISQDIYDNIINEVNEGTKTIDDAIEEIQGILGVIAYDTVTDDVVPNEPDPDTGGNKKKEEVLKENKDNMTFTLAGLENIFPFCIPWDIYSFITILEAEPDAPEFDFPIKSVNNQTENIHVDLSPFEPVAVVVRYIFDFLFIIGLALLTRSLIGAGGGD